MPKRKTVFAEGEQYHLFNRGNNSQKIFHTAENYLVFLDYIVASLPSTSVRIHSFSLLPNHFHLSITLEKAFDLSSAMRRLLRAYALRFNKIFHRHGHVFECPFKSIRIESLEYLDYLSRYIHRNPVEAGLVANPDEWQFSSYRSYMTGESMKKAGNISGMLFKKLGGWKVPEIDLSSTMSRFRTSRDYRDFVLCDWERDPWRLEGGLWTSMKSGEDVSWNILR
jgi:REP element-mobilizing transposase RayT